MNKNDATILAIKARWELAEPTDVTYKQLGNGEWVVVAKYRFGDFYIWGPGDIVTAPGKKGYRHNGRQATNS